MKTVFRVDSSLEIGTGHVQRCLTLATQLKLKQVEICFICRELPGNAIHLIENCGFNVFRLPYNPSILNELTELSAHKQWLGETLATDITQVKIILDSINNVDLLVIDSYALDIEFEKELRKNTKKIMVIDDLADRVHDCDFLLDQNFCEEQSRYKSLVASNSCILQGPKYALLRQEFLKARNKAKIRDGNINRVLVFFGGIDITNETEKALNALSILNFSGDIDVVVGNANPHKTKIKAICDANLKYKYHCQIDNIAELMLLADLSIGAGGSTTWERCCLGLPTLIIAVAANQVSIAEVGHKNGFLLYLGKAEELTSTDIADVITSLTSHRNTLKSISTKAFTLVDALGATRVCEQILGELYE